MRRERSTFSTSIAFPLAMIERLKAISDQLGVPTSRLIRDAVEKELPLLERRVELLKGELPAAAAPAAKAAQRS